MNTYAVPLRHHQEERYLYKIKLFYDDKGINRYSALKILLRINSKLGDFATRRDVLLNIVCYCNSLENLIHKLACA